jgi:hypothetical protein
MGINIETIFDVGIRKERHSPKLKEWANEGYLENEIRFPGLSKTVSADSFRSMSFEEKIDFYMDCDLEIFSFSFNEVKSAGIEDGRLHLLKEYSHFHFLYREYQFREDENIRNRVAGFSKWLAHELGAGRYFFVDDMWNDGELADFHDLDYDTIVEKRKKSILNEDLGFKQYAPASNR